jgi:hypothetical protein
MSSEWGGNYHVSNSIFAKGWTPAAMEDDYENCAGRTFYRVIGNDPPTLRDFFSYRDLGKPLLDRSPAGLENWTGVSVYEKRRQAVALAKYLIRRSRPAGTLVAELRIPKDVNIPGKRMGGDGHFNLFVDPSTLLECYHEIAAVLARSSEVRGP